MSGARESQTRSRMLSFGAALGLALVVAVVFLASSDSGRSAGIREGDLHDQLLPLADRVGEALSAGRIPYWNADIGCGLDQYVTLVSATCYPPTWLYAILPPPAGMGVLVVFHLLLAATGVFIWTRSVGVGTGAALVGASVVVFGLIGESWWPPMLHVACWTPVIFALVDHPSLRGSTRWSLIALCAGLQCLAGYPQFVLYSHMIVAAYVMVRGIKLRSARAVALPVSALAMGALVAGVQLIPSMTFLQTQSSRGGRLTPDEVHYLSGGAPTEPFHEQMVRMVPKMLENGEKDRILSNRFSYGYLGILPPFALAACLLGGLNWRIGFFAIAAAVGLYLSTGYSPTPIPAYDWFAKLPMVGSFRTPDRLLFWSLIAVSFLTAVGVDRIWSSGGSMRRPALFLAAALFLVAVRGALWWKLGGTAISLALWASGAACVVAAGWYAVRGVPGARRPLGALLTCAVAFTLADLWFAAGFVCPYIDFPKERYDRIATREGTLLTHEQLNDVADLARNDRIYIAAAYRPVMRTRMLPVELNSLPFSEGMMPTRHRMLDNMLHGEEEHRTRHFGFYDLDPAEHIRFWDYCAVRVLVADEPIPDARENGWIPSSDGVDGAHVYMNESVVPRAALVRKYEVATPEAAREFLLGRGEPREPVRAILEQPPAKAWAEAVRAGAGRSAPGRAEISAHDPERVVIDTWCDEPALLLLADSYAPGWECRVDGRPMLIHRANYLHRAVELEAGSHTVVFEYRPPGLARGALVSGIALTIVAGVPLFAGLRARREARRSETRLSFTPGSERIS